MECSFVLYSDSKNSSSSSSSTRPTKRAKCEPTGSGTVGRMITIVNNQEDYRHLAESCKADYAVELGCGVGHTVVLLSRCVSPEKVMGIDVTWKHIQAAKKNHPLLHFERLDCVEDADYVVQLMQRETENCKIVHCFVDLGVPHENHLDYGITELTSLVQVLPMLVQRVQASSIVVKSPQLYALYCGSTWTSNFWSGTVLPAQENILMSVKSSSSSSAASAVSIASTASTAASTLSGPPLQLHPMKLSQKFATDGIEICRYHNYSADGCLRGKQGRCRLNHNHCHWCGQSGHCALDCTSTKEGALDAFGVDARLKPPMKEPSQFLFVMGGRLRGKTLMQCERLMLSSLDISTTTTKMKQQMTSIDRPSWELTSSLLQHRGSHCAVALLDGTVLVSGGGGMRANLSSCERLDGRTRTWIACPSMHTPRHAFSMCVDLSTNDVFVTGGWTHGSRCIGTFEMLKKGSAVWKVCAPMIMPRRLHGSAVVDGKVYVFGGSPGSDKEQKLTTNCVECYDTMKHLWIQKNNMPISSHCVAINVGSDIFVLPFGDSMMFKYTVIDDQYIEMSALPLQNWHGFAVASDFVSNLYVVGGTTDGRWSRKAFCYNVVSNAWTEMPELSLPRRRTAIAIGRSY